MTIIVILLSAEQENTELKKNFSEFNNMFKKKTLFCSPWYSEYTFGEKESRVYMQDIFMFCLHVDSQPSSDPRILPQLIQNFCFSDCSIVSIALLLQVERQALMQKQGASTWYEFIHPFSKHFSSTLSAKLRLGCCDFWELPHPLISEIVLVRTA